MIDSNDFAQAKSTPNTVDNCIVPNERRDVYKAVRRRIEQKYSVRLSKKINRIARDAGSFSVSIAGPTDCATKARDELLRFIYPLHEHSYDYTQQMESVISSPGFIEQLEADYDCSILMQRDLWFLKLFGSQEAVITVISALYSIADVNWLDESVGATSNTNADAATVQAPDVTGRQAQSAEAADTATSADSWSEAKLDEELRRLCAIHNEQYEDYADVAPNMKRHMLKWLYEQHSQGDVPEQAQDNARFHSFYEPASEQASSKSTDTLPAKHESGETDARGDANAAESDLTKFTSGTGNHDYFDASFAAVEISLFEEAANPSLSKYQLMQRGLQRGRLIDEALAIPQSEQLPMPLSASPNDKRSKRTHRTQEQEQASRDATLFMSPVPEPAHDELRSIIIDGNNVAREHGRVAKVYSSRGIRLAVEYFRKRGHQDIIVYIPQWRPFGNRAVPPTADGHLLVEMHDEGLLEYTPSRKNPMTGRHEAAYDDWYIVNAAHLKDGVIVSNDQFRDVISTFPEFKSTVAERSLPFNFLGDNFIVPPDPRGRFAPSLDQLLRKSAPLHTGPTAPPSASTSTLQVDKSRPQPSAASSSNAPGKPSLPPTRSLNDQNNLHSVSYPTAAPNYPYWLSNSNQPTVSSNNQLFGFNPMLNNTQWARNVGYTPQIPPPTSVPNPLGNGKPGLHNSKKKRNRKNNLNVPGSHLPQQLAEESNQTRYDCGREDIALDSDEELFLLEKALQISQNSV